uniref:Uncharacterized protein n=1 Tax=Cucumis melo TaxID=3656 RepID=A0A9I9EEG8_CUCME
MPSQWGNAPLSIILLELALPLVNMEHNSLETVFQLGKPHSVFCWGNKKNSFSAHFHGSFLFRFSTVAFSFVGFSSVAFPPIARPSFFNRFAPPKVSGGLRFDSELKYFHYICHNFRELLEFEFELYLRFEFSIF